MALSSFSSRKSGCLWNTSPEIRSRSICSSSHRSRMLLKVSQISSGRLFVYSGPASGLTPRCRSDVCMNFILKFPFLFLWKDYDKPGLMIIALGRDSAAVKFHDLFCDGKTEPRSSGFTGPGIVRPEEFLKNMLQLVIGNFRSFVDKDNQRVTLIL